MVRLACLWICLLAACGAKNEIPLEVDASGIQGPFPQPESCNGLDDDLDGHLDEDFRDEIGRYVGDEHCGSCARPCGELPPERGRHCALIDEVPVCVAASCDAGYAISDAGRCRDMTAALCMPCLADDDCGDITSARCERVGGESRCLVNCEEGCPLGYECQVGACVPTGGSCICGDDHSFTLACGIEVVTGEGISLCAGTSRCERGVLSECVGTEERCDEVDNDCDGDVDEPWRDVRGAYGTDEHCGGCGIRCGDAAPVSRDLVCGGDPLAPSCVLHCPDVDDGVHPGDRVDADREIATGCECRVTATDDSPGPEGTAGEALDANCDGADGNVIESFYVTSTGDDTAIGSPTTSLASIGEALRRAAESLTTDAPRPHIFVASGTYVETLTIPDGISLYGGYRADFLALDPRGFRVEVRAPADTSAPGGAALMILDDVGTEETTLSWLSFQGADAPPGGPAFGALISRTGSGLALMDLEITAGRAGRGVTGRDGEPGASSLTEAVVGDPPRGAIESARHVCTPGFPNVVTGGAGGENSCESRMVSGGLGGSPSCPTHSLQQPSGMRGRSGAGGGGGAGGEGGRDSLGPIRGRSCDRDVCCGLADFTVPDGIAGPQDGARGGDGSGGRSGAGCADWAGDFSAGRWSPGVAVPGVSGESGGGGGGGGSGGGVEMEWVRVECEFTDGIGGGGGGGGAGGCGGGAGVVGSSGGPAVAVVIELGGPAPSIPTVARLRLSTGGGGRGGDGGSGGLGGLGGRGALGGAIPRVERSTPTLAAPFSGGRGGQGGNGGGGGGGGGGCGGGSLGVWVVGGAPDGDVVAMFEGAAVFELGRGGDGGRGGGGGTSGADGASGEALDVLVD